MSFLLPYQLCIPNFNLFGPIELILIQDATFVAHLSLTVTWSTNLISYVISIALSSMCSKFQLIWSNRNRSNNKLSTLIIEMSADSHKLAVNLGSLNFKWNQYKVYDTFAVSRCFKCCHFGHQIKDCKEEFSICPRCAGNHEISLCKSISKKCINCVESLLKFNLNLNVAHPAYSSDCPTMQQKLSKLKSAYTRKF
jgi:hypothetical protein